MMRWQQTLQNLVYGVSFCGAIFSCESCESVCNQRNPNPRSLVSFLLEKCRCCGMVCCKCHKAKLSLRHLNLHIRCMAIDFAWYSLGKKLTTGKTENRESNWQNLHMTISFASESKVSKRYDSEQHLIREKAILEGMHKRGIPVCTFLASVAVPTVYAAFFDRCLLFQDAKFLGFNDPLKLCLARQLMLAVDKLNSMEFVCVNLSPWTVGILGDNLRLLNICKVKKCGDLLLTPCGQAGYKCSALYEIGVVVVSRYIDWFSVAAILIHMQSRDQSSALWFEPSDPRRQLLHSYFCAHKIECIEMLLNLFTPWAVLLTNMVCTADNNVKTVQCNLQNPVCDQFFA